LAGITYRLFKETEDPYSLQKFIEVGVKGRRCLCGVDIGVQFLSVGFRERWFLQLGIGVEVSESNPIVECDSPKAK